MPPASSLVAPGIVRLFDQTLTASAASLDTGATIPSGYTTLRIQCYLRTDETGNAVGANLNFNNDSGANYDRNQTRANGGLSQIVQQGLTTLNVLLAGAVSSSANSFGVSDFTIPGYASTTGYKTLIGQSAVFGLLGTTSSYYFDQIACLWRSTNAINQIKVAPFTGGNNLVAGSRLTIYGM